MAMQPLITFKAGLCEVPESGRKTITALPTPGFVYLYNSTEDELTHFCWTPRSNPTSEPEIDLIMLPTDGTFSPYTDPKVTSDDVVSPTNGRIYRLKFSSSPQRYFFWLQSKPSHSSGKPNYFSERDLEIGRIVNTILQGDEIDVQAALSQVGQGRTDEDEDMGDAPSDHELRRQSTGGAGSGATGGDFRNEGEDSREGGADGGRAASSGMATDASAAVQNFLRSLQGGGGTQQAQQGSMFTTLPDLLTPEACIATLDNASTEYLDSLLSYLPPQIISLDQQTDDITSFDSGEDGSNSVTINSLSVGQKKELLRRVFRTPQLYQSLGSLTMALRDGGLPMISDALKIDVENGGLIRGGHVPLGDGTAVAAFLDGVKKTVKEENEKDKSKSHGNMDSS